MPVTTDEQLDAAYSDVKSVISIGRGIGYWGDMVVELRNGDKIEMRALPRCGLEYGTQPEQDTDDSHASGPGVKERPVEGVG